MRRWLHSAFHEDPSFGCTRLGEIVCRAQETAQFFPKRFSASCAFLFLESSFAASSYSFTAACVWPCVSNKRPIHSCTTEGDGNPERFGAFCKYSFRSCSAFATFSFFKISAMAR